MKSFRLRFVLANGQAALITIAQDVLRDRIFVPRSARPVDRLFEVRRRRFASVVIKERQRRLRVGQTGFRGLRQKVERSRAVDFRSVEPPRQRSPFAVERVRGASRLFF